MFFHMYTFCLLVRKTICYLNTKHKTYYLEEEKIEILSSTLLTHTSS